MFCDKKLILVKNNYQGCKYESDQPEITVEEVNTPKLFVELACQTDVYNLLKAILENPIAQNALEQLGYLNVEKLKSEQDKVVLNKRLFLFTYKYKQLEEISSLEKVSSYDLELLAKEEAILLQEVSLTTLGKISSKVYKKYKEIKARILSQQEKQKLSAQKRAKKKRDKQVAEAKKLLEEEGVL